MPEGSKVAAELCAREGFRGGPLFDITGTLQLLHSVHVRERDKALLRGVLIGGVWNGVPFEWGQVNSLFHAGSCGVADGEGHLFLDMYLSSLC